MSRAIVLAVAVGALGLAVSVRADGRDQHTAALDVASGATTTTSQSTVNFAANPTSTSPTTVQSGAKATTTSTTSITTLANPTATKAFCDLARTSTDLVRRISVALTDPDQLRSLLEKADAALGQSAPLTPTDAKAGIGSLQSTVVTVHAALDVAGYDVAKLSPDLVVKLSSPDVRDALRIVDGYVNRAC